MSTLPSNDVPRKQPPSIYTVMLILSTLFMLIAVIAMSVELSRWWPDLSDTSSARPSVMVIDSSNDFFG